MSPEQSAFDPVATYREHLNHIPKGFDALAALDLRQLRTQVAALPEADRIRKLGRLLFQLEAYKIITGYFIPRSEQWRLRPSREGILYQDLLPLVVIHELLANGPGKQATQRWNELARGDGPLAALASTLVSQRFNRIRNAIAHASVDFDDDMLVWQDGRVKLLEASRLASALSLLVALCGSEEGAAFL